MSTGELDTEARVVSELPRLVETRALRWRGLAILDEALAAIDKLAATQPHAGRARAELYERRAHSVRQRLLMLRGVLEQLEEIHTSSSTHAPENASNDDWALAERALDLLKTDFGLTAREREVAEHIVKGYTNREIAAKLVITPGTAANHVRSVFAKLGCHHRAQLMFKVFSHDPLRNGD